MLTLDERHLQAFIDAIPTPVFVKDRSSRPVLVNRSACDFYGLSREQILHGQPEEMFTSAQARSFRETDERVFSTGEDIEYEEQATDASGDQRTFVTRKRLMKALDGEQYVIGVASDITALREAEEHYHHFVELNPQIPWTADADGSIDEIGPRGEEITGRPAEQTRGEGWLEVVHPVDLDQVGPAWRQALTTGDALDTEYRIRTRDDSYRWFRARASARKNTNGKIIRWYGTLEDIHEKKLAEHALQQSEERFRLAARAAGLGVWDYDAVEGKRTWSPDLKRIFGLSENAPADLSLARSLIHEDDQEQFDGMVRAVGNNDVSCQLKASFRISRANDGDKRWVETNGWKVVEGGRLTRVVITIRDITEEREADARLVWSATHDPLTKLPNRALFQERLEAAIEDSRTTGGRTGLLLLDVDHLKQINDTFGHSAGDELLKLFAGRLQGSVRSGDTVARLGGDEFAVILPNIANKKEIDRVANRIIIQMREPFEYEQRQVTIRPSIGVSHFPSHGDAPDEILRAADLALYTAKSTARGSLAAFNSRMKIRERRRNTMIISARQAVRDDRIVPFYQPKVEIATGRIIGFEALLRWRRATGAIQGPSSIIAAFSNHELASMIRDRMMDRIFADVREWLDCGIEFGDVAINAGEAELRDEKFAHQLLERLNREAIPTTQVQLEVVESVFVGRGAEHIEKTLNTLSREGVLIALDDFGTGYASLTHLNRYPVDVVKIDRSFVQDMESNANNAAIVGAVTGLGRNLGIAVVAEGIERAEQVNLLGEAGCKFGQGYLFSRAVPASHVPRFFADKEDMQRKGALEARSC